MSELKALKCIFSCTELRRLSAAEKIWSETPEQRGEVGYLARCFLVANLPLTEPSDTNVWSRKNGDATLTIQPGFVADYGRLACVGYPYGSTARWLLLYICTESVRQQSPHVSLGPTLTRFLRTLGFPTDGRRHRAVREQLDRLLLASIRYVFRDHETLAGRNLSLASEFLLWKSENGHRALGFATLNEAVFRDLTAHAIPLDLGALRALRDAPLAMDLFCWLSFRLRSLRHPLTLGWLALQPQFGADFAKPKEFARHMRRALRRVQHVWPELKLRYFRGGVTFFPPEKLPVAMRGRKCR
jgi:hypothetical protein